MGKIRVRAFGIEELEKKQQTEAKLRKEQKKTTKVPGLKGGQRIVAVGPSEEELAKIESSVIATPSEARGKQSQDGIATSFDKLRTRNDKVKKEESNKPKKLKSKNYQEAAKLVDKTKTYTLPEAVELLLKIKRAKFDETVELHINTVEKGNAATVTLPHGSGKKVRVAIADDKIVENIIKGKIDFDILLAQPSMMPKLARVAKFLGPRGLMPNPKSGTIVNNPEELAKKYEGGQVYFKSEAKAPIMHLSVGKLSFGQQKLAENIKVVLDVIKKQNIQKITLKSTMSPGIKIENSQ